MRTIVLDASALLACLFKDGRARATLLHTEGTVLVAPPGILEEVERQLPRVAKRVGITIPEARAVLNILLEHVQEVSLDALRPFEAQAKALARNAGDVNDWEYVALALALDAPIWTYDDDFGRVAGIDVVRTGAIRDSP